MHFLIALLLLAAGLSAAFAQSPRDREIAECRGGDIAVWPDGIDRPAGHAALRFAYRHEHAPFWLGRNEIEILVARAAKAWTECGIPATAAAAAPADPRDPDTVVVQWDEAGSLGNFGLSNLAARTLSLGPKAFALLRSRNPAHDPLQTLQMVLSHEMGHFFGLMAHSRRCVDVLSYYHDAKGGKCFTRDPAGIGAGVEYRHVLPTACDIARCRAVNGLPAPRGAASAK